MSSLPHGLSTRRGRSPSGGGGTTHSAGGRSGGGSASATDELLAGDDHRLAGLGRRRLGVDANERLRPGGPDEQPRAVAGEELVAIVRGESVGPRDGLAVQRG